MKSKSRTFACLSAAAKVLNLHEDILRHAKKQGCPAFRSNGNVNEAELVAWLNAPRESNAPDEQAAPWARSLSEIHYLLQSEGTFDHVTSEDLDDLAYEFGQKLSMAMERGQAAGIAVPERYSAAISVLFGPEMMAELARYEVHPRKRAAV